jgi:hypothetical protein
MLGARTVSKYLLFSLGISVAGSTVNNLRNHGEYYAGDQRDHKIRFFLQRQFKSGSPSLLLVRSRIGSVGMRPIGDHLHLDIFYLEAKEKKSMQFYIALQPMVALIAGILILVIPRILNLVVALYLILTGILGLIKM